MTKQAPKYTAAHMRVYRELGKASQYKCVDCGGSARQWSYLGGALDELVHNGLRYSLDSSYYQPRCTSCHVTFDNNNNRS